MQLNTSLVVGERNASCRRETRRRMNGMEPYLGCERRVFRCWQCAGALIVTVVNLIPNATPEGSSVFGSIVSWFVESALWQVYIQFDLFFGEYAHLAGTLSYSESCPQQACRPSTRWTPFWPDILPLRLACR